MNREEAAAILKDNLYGFVGDDITEALYLAVEALEGPAPDPITGLVPCGCGGKAVMVKDKTLYSGRDLDWYIVRCPKEHAYTGGSFSEKEARMDWNIAMGWEVPNA